MKTIQEVLKEVFQAKSIPDLKVRFPDVMADLASEKGTFHDLAHQVFDTTLTELVKQGESCQAGPITSALAAAFMAGMDYKRILSEEEARLKSEMESAKKKPSVYNRVMNWIDGDGGWPQ